MTSKLNISNIPLPENGVYTGDFEFLHSYQSISVLINTNVNGSVKYHFSNDGETIYHTEEFNIIGNTSFYKTVVKKGSYFRAEYFNAGVAQDTFKLITIYRKDSPDIEFDNLDTVNCKQSGEWSFSLGETSNLYVSDALTHQKLDGINSNIFSVKNNTSDTAINTLGISIDTSNINTKLEGIYNNTSNIDTNLSNLSQQSVTTKKDNEIILNAPSGVLAYADTVPIPIKDPFNRSGWYYQNTLATNKFNYYYFSNTGFTLKLGDVKGQYCIFQNDTLTTNNVNVILSLYGPDGFLPTGARRVYSSNQKIEPGVKYLVYWGVDPLIFPELPRIQYTLADERNWDNNLNVLTMSVGSDSGYDALNVRNLMTHIGYVNAEDVPTTTMLIESLDALNSSSQLVGLNETIKNNTSDTAINTLGISNDTTSINNKITSGQQTMSNSIPVVLASNQVLSTNITNITKQGSENNIANNETILPGAVSSLVALVDNMKQCNIVYNDDSGVVFDNVGVEVSGDGINYHKVGEIYPFVSSGSTLRRGYLFLNVGGFVNLRIRNQSASESYNSVNCSIYGVS